MNGETVTISSGQTTTFVEGETLFVTTGEENLQAVVKINSSVANPIGFGSIAYIEEGVYYVQGKMVRVDSQKIILNKYFKNDIISPGFFTKYWDKKIPTILINLVNRLPNIFFQEHFLKEISLKARNTSFKIRVSEETPIILEIISVAIIETDNNRK